MLMMMMMMMMMMMLTGERPQHHRQRLRLLLLHTQGIWQRLAWAACNWYFQGEPSALLAATRAVTEQVICK